jgi:hypothetical protein
MKKYLFRITQIVEVKANTLSKAHILLPQTRYSATKYDIQEETIDLLEETPV